MKEISLLTKGGGVNILHIFVQLQVALLEPEGDIRGPEALQSHQNDVSHGWAKGTIPIIIDREAREIMYLVVSVRLSVGHRSHG